MEVNINLNLSIFSYLFYGILLSNTKCSGCDTILYNYQYFQFISFPAFNFDNKYFNIYSGLKEFIKTYQTIDVKRPAIKVRECNAWIRQPS